MLHRCFLNLRRRNLTTHEGIKNKSPRSPKIPKSKTSSPRIAARRQCFSGEMMDFATISPGPLQSDKSLRDGALHAFPFSGFRAEDLLHPDPDQSRGHAPSRYEKAISPEARWRMQSPTRSRGVNRLCLKRQISLKDQNHKPSSDSGPRPVTIHKPRSQEEKTRT